MLSQENKKWLLSSIGQRLTNASAKERKELQNHCQTKFDKAEKLNLPFVLSQLMRVPQDEYLEFTPDQACQELSSWARVGPRRSENKEFTDHCRKKPNNALEIDFKNAPFPEIVKYLRDNGIDYSSGVPPFKGEACKVGALLGLGNPSLFDYEYLKKDELPEALFEDPIDASILVNPYSISTILTREEEVIDQDLKTPHKWYNSAQIRQRMDSNPGINFENARMSHVVADKQRLRRLAHQYFGVSLTDLFSKAKQDFDYRDQDFKENLLNSITENEKYDKIQNVLLKNRNVLLLPVNIERPRIELLPFILAIDQKGISEEWLNTPIDQIVKQIIKPEDEKKLIFSANAEQKLAFFYTKGKNPPTLILIAEGKQGSSERFDEIAQNVFRGILDQEVKYKDFKTFSKIGVPRIIITKDVSPATLALAHDYIIPLSGLISIPFLFFEKITREIYMKRNLLPCIEFQEDIKLDRKKILAIDDAEIVRGKKLPENVFRNLKLQVSYPKKCKIKFFTFIITDDADKKSKQYFGWGTVAHKSIPYTTAFNISVLISTTTDYLSNRIKFGRICSENEDTNYQWFFDIFEVPPELRPYTENWPKEIKENNRLLRQFLLKSSLKM